MEHHIVIDKYEGRTDDYDGYKITVCEILVEDTPTGWPDACATAKKVIEVERIKDKWNGVSNHLGDRPRPVPYHERIGGSNSETVYECYSRKTEPLILE